MKIGMISRRLTTLVLAAALTVPFILAGGESVLSRSDDHSHYAASIEDSGTPTALRRIKLVVDCLKVDVGPRKLRKRCEEWPRLVQDATGHSGSEPAG